MPPMTQNDDPSALVNLAVPQRFYLQMVSHLAHLSGEAEIPAAPGKVAVLPDTIELDEALVTRMYAESESRHRRLLKALALEAGQWVFTADLSKELGVTSGTKGMAGIFGAFGRRAKHRYGGRKPWQSKWDSVRGEACYRMDPEVAGWIARAAREEDG
jgi:hypothetical protein